MTGPFDHDDDPDLDRQGPCRFCGEWMDAAALDDIGLCDDCAAPFDDDFSWED